MSRSDSPVAGSVTPRPRLVRRLRLSVLALALPAVLFVSLPAAPSRAAAADLVLEQMLTQDPPHSSGRFGALVSLDGDRLAVYAQDWNASTPGNTRTVGYYRRGAGGWVLAHSFPVPNDYISSIDLSQNSLAVSMPYQQSGQIRVYALDQPSAEPVIIRDPFDSPVDVPYSGFASSVAVDGNRLIVGVDGDPGKRYALVYERSGASWAPAPGGTLLPGGPPSGWFGRTVAISGDIAVVPDATSAYVYRRSASGWAFEAAIPSPTGMQLDVHAGALLSGGQLALIPNISNAGKQIFLYSEKAGGWTLDQQVPVDQGFLSAAMSGSELAVVDAAGGIRVWDRNASNWVLGSSGQLQPDGTPFDTPWIYTSLAMDVSDRHVAIGIPEARPGNQYDAGSVRLFARGGTAAQPPGAVSQLRVKASATTGTATVSWRAAAGQVSRYQVTAEPQLATGGAQKIVSAGTTSVVITGLRELAPYRFTVQASGAGGDGPLVRSAVVSMGGPKPVASPYTVSDPRDVSDPRQDIRSLRVEATGAAVTVELRTADPRNPYQDSMFRRPTDSRFRVTWRVPGVEWQSIFDHASINDGLRIAGEDFTLRFRVPRPCHNPDAVFPARYVDGAYQATVPSRCFQYSRALRFQGVSDVGGDRTSWTPPVTRLGSKGSVSVSKVKVSSVALGTGGEGRRTISFRASHRSGIKSATIRAFSLATGQRPIRVGKTTCAKKSKKVSVCKATIRLRPGEVRDQDAGRWRVFVEAKSRGGSIAVKEDVKQFSVRRATTIGGSATASGSSLTVAGTLTGASWNTGQRVPLANTSMVLERKAPKSAKYKAVATLRTGADGTTASTVRTATSGKFRLRFATTSTYAGKTVGLAVRR